MNRIEKGLLEIEELIKKDRRDREELEKPLQTSEPGAHEVPTRPSLSEFRTLDGRGLLRIMLDNGERGLNLSTEQEGGRRRKPSPV